MKKIILIFLASISICFGQKQTIEQAEYYIGDDPGEGKATPLQLANFGDATVNITWKELPKISRGQSVYVRVKSSGFMPNTGIYKDGVWSLPMIMKFPTTATIKSAEAKIVRPSLPYPILKAAWASDGKFDDVIDSVQVIIKKDSLQIADTLKLRLQGDCDLWGDWVQIPITKEIFTSVDDNTSTTSFPFFQINPNPTSDFIYITLQNIDIDKFSILITDLDGKIVANSNDLIKELNQNQLLLNLNPLSNGVYYITIKQNEFYISKPIIIKR